MYSAVTERDVRETALLNICMCVRESMEEAAVIIFRPGESAISPSVSLIVM